MANDYGFGFVIGFIIGALIMTTVAIFHRDRGREECEAPLKRTDSCVQRWVPAKEPHQ